MGIEFKTQNGSVILNAADGDGAIEVKLPRTTELAAFDFSNVPDNVIKDKIGVDFSEVQSKEPTLSVSSDSITAYDTLTGSFTIESNQNIAFNTPTYGTIKMDMSNNSFTYTPIADKINLDSTVNETVSAYTTQEGYLRSLNTKVSFSIYRPKMETDDALVNSDLQADESPDVNPDGFNFI